jgi:hypothetical protein
VKYLIPILCLAFSVSAQAQESPEDYQRRFDALMYGDLRKVEYFGFIHAHIKNDESARIGITESEMTDFLKLRFKNNFGSTPYKDLGSKLLEQKNPESIGYLWCGVWTVGDDFPIAYHVECKGGSLSKPTILTDAVLGYGNKRNVPEAIKKSIDGMLAQFAVRFFKTRGEL